MNELLSARMKTYKIETVSTVPYENQMIGTDGIRKPTQIFLQPRYTENFIQSIFNYHGDRLERSTIILGGDGRYFCFEAAEIIVRMAAANKVGRLIVGQNALMSTPAQSNLIRKKKARGGIILTASETPGGPDQFFGIKFESSNGGAATPTVTDAIFRETTKIQSYKIVPDLEFNISEIGSTVYTIEDRPFELQVINPVTDYVTMLREIFDFRALEKLLRGTEDRPPFSILIDCMNAVTGPYAKVIFEDELRAPQGSVINSVPLKNFGGIRPDPGHNHSKALIDRLITGHFDFGSAYDGDGDRYMILGKDAFYVNASDSLAIIASHLYCIPYFQKHGLSGVARSMPTSRAIDRVAKDRNWPVYVVPTGWKFFCNLLDAGKISLCGEESFETGSRHIREKDGIWASLAWLSVVHHMQMNVEDITCLYWAKYGRDFYMRHDYENLDSLVVDRILDAIIPRIETASPKHSWKFEKKNGVETVTVLNCVEFAYKDPVDQTLVKNQGHIVLLTNESRIIFRKAGSMSMGTTLRVYMERPLPGEMWIYPIEQVIHPLIQVYFDLSQIREITGRTGPDVVT